MFKRVVEANRLVVVVQEQVPSHSLAYSRVFNLLRPSAKDLPLSHAPNRCRGLAG